MKNVGVLDHNFLVKGILSIKQFLTILHFYTMIQKIINKL